MKIPKKLTNYYYWLQTLMMILAVLLTYSISLWLTLMFIVAISGLIENRYDIDLPFKEHDRIIFHDNTGLHDYYFVRYADSGQKQAYITIFPGGETSFHKLVDVNSFYKEH